MTTHQDTDWRMLISWAMNALLTMLIGIIGYTMNEQAIAFREIRDTVIQTQVLTAAQGNQITVNTGRISRLEQQIDEIRKQK